MTFAMTALSGASAHADPDGWTCPASWYGTNDGCDCGCNRLDPDCSSAKASACEYSFRCGGIEQVIHSQNWRCDGQPLSKPWPNTGPAQIPQSWLGTEEQFLDNVCSCGLGAFDYACDGATFSSCEAYTPVCEQTGGTWPSPLNNWSCDGWSRAPWYYGTGDGCDCGYGDPDPDCASGSASDCEYVNNYCSGAIASDANWVCGGELDRAALVPDSSYCADTVDWDPNYIRIEELILKRINLLRAQGATCGTEGYFPPAQPLKMDPNLRCAARLYSRGPLVGGMCSHTGPSGDQPWDRADLAGYDADCLGENMFCAQAMSGYAADEWMLSDGHCATLMRNDVNEVGLGVGYYTVMMTGAR